MNAMIRIKTHPGTIAAVLATIVYDGLIIIADANGWSRQAHAAIALFTLVIMIGAWLLIMSAEERRWLRSVYGRGVRWLWRRIAHRRPRP